MIRWALKKPFQVHLADWAFTCATTSLIVPLVGLFGLFGISSGSWTAFLCAVLGILCALSAWMLHEMQKNSFRFRTIGWLFAVCCFSVVIACVFRFFDSLKLALIFAVPEAVGALIGVVGLIHSVITPADTP